MIKFKTKSRNRFVKTDLGLFKLKPGWFLSVENGLIRTLSGSGWSSSESGFHPIDRWPHRNLVSPVLPRNQPHSVWILSHFYSKSTLRFNRINNYFKPLTRQGIRRATNYNRRTPVKLRYWPNLNQKLRTIYENEAGRTYNLTMASITSINNQISRKPKLKFGELDEFEPINSVTKQYNSIHNSTLIIIIKLIITTKLMNKQHKSQKDFGKNMKITFLW